jgi:apolipoprotein N-acyltransferase
MVDLIGTPNAKKRRFPSALQAATTIYGLLYLYFFIWSFIPCSGAVNPISDSPNVDPWDLGMIFVKLLFLVFLVGYFYSWKNGGIAGLIFLFWFILMVCMAIWVEKTLHRDSDMAIPMAMPLLVIGILFIVSWYKKKRATPSA